ncbi:MAG: class I SAM-dependent methyltransferase [bacterium JZ-2024 1]
MSLKDFLLEEFRSKGPIRFDVFMHHCLYHPEFGYYTSGTVKIGREGDYFTNPCVHPIFGWTFAHFVLKRMEGTMEGKILPPGCSFVELGGGEGHFASDFLSYFLSHRRNQEIHYIIVESSPALRKRQQSLLERIPYPVNWVPDIEKLPKFSGVVFSNEFFDALPIRRFVVQNGSAREIYVVWKDDQWQEELLEASEIPEQVQSALSSPSVCQVEYAPDLIPILNTLCRKMKAGIWITVDYGEEGNLWEIYPTGTIRGYKGHRMILNPLLLPGMMDITALVPFQEMKRILARKKFSHIRIEPQATFLPKIGIFQVFQDQSLVAGGMERVRLHLGVKTLLNPEGLGETMKVLYAEK